uniref:Helicase domino n=1 Tax=Anopheles maculatus TaxID=74869 RepID=A0A182SXC6_9DIPT
MQPAGTPTSSSSLSSPHKGLPQQQSPTYQPSPSNNTSSSNVNIAAATDASSVEQLSSAPSHTLQQQQQQQQIIISASSGTAASSASGSVEAHNANITSATPGGERTGSGLSDCEGGGRGRGGGTTLTGVEGGVGVVVLPGGTQQQQHESESVGGGGGGAGGFVSEVPGDESTFVVAEKRPIEGGTGSVTSVGGTISEGAIVVVGTSGVGKSYTKTNTTTSSYSPAVAVAAGGQTVLSVGGVVAPTAASSTLVGTATVSKKRIKLETEPEHDISALKKLILEQKYMRLRSIKDRYNEHVAELFFLQTGGNMMEYPVWRKKPPTPAFTNFVRSYKLEPLSSNLEEAGEALKQQSTTRSLSGISTTPSGSICNTLGGATPVSGNNGGSGDETATSLPQGAEIKIPGVGATPVAVSTTLPAAVAQLSQQGHVPGRPQGGRHGMVFGQISVPSALGNSSPLLVPGGTPIIPDRIGIGITPATSSIDRKKQIAASVGVGGHMIKSELLLEGGGNASPGLGCGTNGPNLANTTRGGSINVTSSRTAAANVASSSARSLSTTIHQNGPGLGNGTTTPGALALVAGQQQLGGAAAAPNAAANSNNGSGSEQYTNKARQEVFVMQRVQELQKEGLWTERRLPKVQEPARQKAHWDYLLEEMVWLSADFAHERKWKKACARKCARMVQKHFQDKALAAQRAEKAQELQLRRIAAFVAKEIKTFWANAEKLVDYKHQTKLDEKRKKALDQQLSFIVDQTEKYSQQLVEGMNRTAAAGTLAAAGSKAESLNSSRISSPLRGGLLTGSDDEFCPEAESSGDDEETIAKAEAEAAEAEDRINDEVAALQKESEMDLDDFLKHLPKDYLENRDKIVLSDNEGDDGKGGAAGDDDDEDGDKDFSADEESTDCEDTIREQEKSERNQDHKKEIDELNADNEMSIEELMAKYNKNVPAAGEKMDIDSDDDEAAVAEQDSSARERKRRRRTRSQPMSSDSSPSDDEDDDDDAAADDNSEGLTGSDDDDEDDLSEVESGASEDAMDADEEESFGLKNLLDDEAGGLADGSTVSGKSQSEKDDMLNDAAAIAESIQPKGNTLSSTSVVTPIPVLLKHSLREYQHIGLDWLVTMHDRKLNGILADEMGLGKTIQTISLLAHLACVKGNWGPHLIIVPSSVMLNWEMEFKKWCPGFKILTYYGTPKERKLKRTGWTKVNAFHVCITSYKLVIQDHQSFRRKKWKYLILDEAQNIKNFKSQRWQLLLNFQTEQRLLLTGTPLQNNLMELWSLMHFLMPHVFQSHREFKEWFSNPMAGMIEGNSDYNETIIKRLHKVCTLYVM